MLKERDYENKVEGTITSGKSIGEDLIEIIFKPGMKTWGMFS